MLDGGNSFQNNPELLLSPEPPTPPVPTESSPLHEYLSIPEQRLYSYMERRPEKPVSVMELGALLGPAFADEDKDRYVESFFARLRQHDIGERLRTDADVKRPRFWMESVKVEVIEAPKNDEIVPKAKKTDPRRQEMKTQTKVEKKLLANEMRSGQVTFVPESKLLSKTPTSESELIEFAKRHGSDENQELDWQEDGTCRQVDPEIFFPEKGGSTKEAKRVCAGCDVRDKCLQYALNGDERFGIWGGLSERERRRLKRQAS